jgi:hypothetical protein
VLAGEEKMHLVAVGAKIYIDVDVLVEVKVEAVIVVMAAGIVAAAAGTVDLFQFLIGQLDLICFVVLLFVVVSVEKFHDSSLFFVLMKIVHGHNV